MNQLQEMTIGVLADTHLPYRLKTLPQRVFEIFADVDLILHAGDVDKIDYLADLAALAPLQAVRGNIHFSDFSLGGINLPAQINLTLLNHRFVVQHGHRGGPAEILFKLPEIIMSSLSREGAEALNWRTAHRLKKQHPTANCIVFGHTHYAFCRQIDETLCFNPGPVATVRQQKASVGLLHLTPTEIHPQIIPLHPDRYSSNR